MEKFRLYSVKFYWFDDGEYENAGLVLLKDRKGKGRYFDFRELNYLDDDFVYASFL